MTKVAIGVVHGQEMDGWFVNSLVDLLTSKVDSGLSLDDYVLIRSGPLLAAGRGVLVGQFLENTDAEILVMLDDDMAFNPQHVHQLVDVLVQCRKQDPAIAAVGGLAFISNHPRLETPLPNIWIPHPQLPYEMMHMSEIPDDDTLMEVGSTGGACVAIHREPLELFAKANVNPFHHIPKVDWGILAQKVQQLDDLDEIAELMRQQVWDADQYGEDMSFFQRLREAGYRILVHTGIVFDHSKSTLMGLAEYRRAVDRRKNPAQEALSNG